LYDSHSKEQLAKIEKQYGYDNSESKIQDEGKISKKSAIEHMAKVALAEEPLSRPG
jgi:hypothetical protein